MTSPYVFPGLNNEVQWNIHSKDTSSKVDHILMVVCFELKQNIKDLVGPLRKREVVEARQIAMSLIVSNTKMTLAEIGHCFGGRDHSTVTYANTSVASLYNSSKEFRTKFDTITSKLNLTNNYYEKFSDRKTAKR